VWLRGADRVVRSGQCSITAEIICSRSLASRTDNYARTVLCRIAPEWKLRIGYTPPCLKCLISRWWLSVVDQHVLDVGSYADLVRAVVEATPMRLLPTTPLPIWHVPGCTVSAAMISTEQYPVSRGWGGGGGGGGGGGVVGGGWGGGGGGVGGFVGGWGCLVWGGGGGGGVGGEGGGGLLGGGFGGVVCCGWLCVGVLCFFCVGFFFCGAFSGVWFFVFFFLFFFGRRCVVFFVSGGPAPLLEALQCRRSLSAIERHNRTSNEPAVAAVRLKTALARAGLHSQFTDVLSAGRLAVLAHPLGGFSPSVVHLTLAAAQVLHDGDRAAEKHARTFDLLNRAARLPGAVPPRHGASRTPLTSLPGKTQMLRAGETSDLANRPWLNKNAGCDYHTSFSSTGTTTRPRATDSPPSSAQGRPNA